MFYLIQFFKIIGKAPLRGISFIIFSMLLVLSLGQKKYLEEQFLKLVPENNAGPYFYGLVAATESYQKIIAQMTVLPGVYKVELLSESQIKNEVKNILGSLQINLPTSNLDLNYVGMKIIYTKDLNLRSQDLIRDYLSHLVTEGNITLGAVKENDQSLDKKNKLIQGIKTWGFNFILILFFSFWAISLFLLRSKILETSYLLESYQRKKRVSFKISLMGHVIIFSLSLAPVFLFGIPNLVNLAYLLGIFLFGNLFYLKKYTWEAH